jgi:hypothetical protein
MNRNISQHVYGLLLRAYPREFRREYGPQMRQVFRDSCRFRRQGIKFGLLRVWLTTLIDLIQTAPIEHLDRFNKETSVMNNLRRDALAVVGCVAIIVIALFTLQLGRGNQVFSLLLLGYMLDAIVVTGIIGNLVVFLLAKVTNLNPLRIACWTFLVVNLFALTTSLLIGMRVDPQFNLAGVVVGYVVSFLFWYGLHWMWAHKNRGQVAV